VSGFAQIVYEVVFRRVPRSEVREIVVEPGLGDLVDTVVDLLRAANVRLGPRPREEVQRALAELVATQLWQVEDTRAVIPDPPSAFRKVRPRYPSDAPDKVLARAQEMGMEYIGIADHSRSAGYAHGLEPERVKRQLRRLGRHQEMRM